MFTFEIQWPQPFKNEWRRSGQRLETLTEAATEMAKFMVVSFENGCSLNARLVKIGENE